MKFTALLLVALWLPASSHDWLESSGLIHSADQGDHDPNHEAADGVCRVEQGNLILEAPTLSAGWMPAVVAEVITVASSLGQPASDLLPCCSTAPPELARTWQFSERTALPSRPPSFVA